MKKTIVKEILNNWVDKIPSNDISFELDNNKKQIKLSY